MTGTEVGMPPSKPGDELNRTLARAGIRDWISHTGRALLHMTPVAILTSMTAAALAPILIPAFTGASGAADVQSILGQAGNLGTGYLTTAIQQLADRMRGRRESTEETLTEETLREVLRACLEEELSGPRMAQARATITALIQAVDGVNEALAAARGSGMPELTVHLVQAVNDLSRAATEFRGLRDDLLIALDAIQRDTSYLRSAAQDTHDELRRVTIEVATMRRLISRSPVPEAKQQPGGNGVATGDGIASPDDFCPYPGLAPFEVKDAGWFYGRDRLVATLVGELNERLHGDTPLMVTGASGAGKSSVLRAGLIPELHSGALTAAGAADWPYLIMTPTGYPLRQLGVELAFRAGITSSQVIEQIKEEPARAQLIVRQLLRAHEGHRADAPPDPGRRLILVVDQFEEVFTQCGDGAERKAFIEAVCAIARGDRHDPPPVLVVLGMHTSFVEHCTAHPELTPSLVNPVIVGPMTRTELQDAIEAPAKLAGLAVEPGLTQTMLHDIEAVESRDGSGQLTYDPGKLPLLAHALLETWKRRAGNQLTLAAYQAAGGVHEALAESADRVYESLDTAGQGVARRLLLNLARPDEAGDTRRAMDRDALLAELPAGDAPVAVSLLARLERERLLTSDAGNVQITHEALLRYWPTLARWLAEDRDWLRERHLLAEQAREWEASGRHPDRLPRGDVLAEIRRLDADHSADLGDLTRNFLRAAERRARRARRARASLVATLVLLIAVTGGSALVFLHQRTLASRAQQLAQVQQLLAKAAQLHVSQPQISLLLDLEAYRMRQNYDTDNALLSAQDGFFADVLPNRSGAAHSVTYNATGSLIAVGAQAAVSVWRTAGHRLADTFHGASPFYAVAFDPGGDLLAGGEQDGEILVWNLDTHRVAADLNSTSAQSGAGVYALAFSPDGGMLATAGDNGAITLWNTTTWRAARAQPPGACDTVYGLAISPDGTQLAAACSDQRVLIWQLARLAVGPVPLSGHDGPVLAIAFGPDSTHLASAADDGTISIWDARADKIFAVLPGGTTAIDAVAFRPDDGALLASGDADGVVRLWDLDTLTQADALTGPAGSVDGLAFSPDGRTIADADADGTVGLWHVAAPPPPGSLPAPAVVATTRTTAAASDKGIELWNPAQSSGHTTLRLPASPSSLALSPDGADLAAASGQAVDLWNTAGSRVPMPLNAPNPLTSLAVQHAQSGGAIVAAGSTAGLIYVWDVPRRGAATLDPLYGNVPANVTSVAVSPDGRLLAAGCSDGSLLLGIRSPRGLWTATPLPGGPNSAVTSVAFSSDGRLLAAGSENGVTQLWDVSNPENPENQLPKLTGPGGSIVSIAFSDSGTLAAAAADDSIHFWDVRHPGPPATLSGLTGPVSIAWQPGSQTLAGAAPDGTSLTWDINPDDIANRICKASDLPAKAKALIPPYMSGITYRPVCP